MSTETPQGKPGGRRWRRSGRASVVATRLGVRWFRWTWPGAVTRRVGKPDWPEPWRGTKPMEGEDIARSATVGRCTTPGCGATPRGRGSVPQPERARCATQAQRRGGKGPWRHGSGCRQGDFFEGCERRSGNGSECGPGFGSSSIQSSASGPSGSSGSEWARGAETLRTLSGSEMQQARKPSRGVNRRGGEKPRGWTVIRQLVAGGPKAALALLADGQPSARVDATR